MEGISTISKNGKKIYTFEFTNYGKSKEDTVRMITAIGDEFARNPLNSVLALIDVTKAFFHFETFKALKKMEEKCTPYEKKIAIIGLTGLKKAGFNSIVGSKKRDLVKAFDSKIEAEEWLNSD
jgi:hypothetical protein